MLRARSSLGVLERLARGFASCSSAGAEENNKSVLLRDHVGRILTDPVDGYFTNRPHVVGKVQQPLEFKTMLGKSGYDFKIRELYQSTGSSWLTPVEIFQPHYGEGIARYIVSDFQNRKGSKLRICEVGAGNGTLAANVLDYVLRKHPDLYQDVKYTALEVSKPLSKRQEWNVGMHDEAHKARFQSLSFNAMDSKAWASIQEEHVYILGLELLDNLPHDRVELWKNKSQSQSHRWMETWVNYCDQHPHGAQELREMKDDKIRGCFSAYDWAASASGQSKKVEEEESGSGGGVLATLERFITTGKTSKETTNAPSGDGNGGAIVFLPTAAFSFLKNISENVPSHTLLLIDFETLPDVQVAGRNAPLISNTVDALPNDFSSYFVPVGAADIFFPTDFDALRSMYINQMSQNKGEIHTVVDANHVRSDDFFKVYADLNVTTTLSGYNPLIEDFLNTRVFIGSRGSDPSIDRSIVGDR